MRSYLAFLFACGASLASAADTGTMQLTVRDSHTHLPIHAVIQGSGPKSFSVATDDRGYGTVALPPGEYQLQISASDYAPLRTHYSVGRGKITKAGAFIDPLSLPHEEGSEVLDSLERPGHTLLHEYVLDEETGQPLSGVRVRFVHGAVKTTTDSSGHFYLLVPTPAPDFPGGVGTDTLIYEKSGYKAIVMKNLPVEPEEMGGTGIDMKRGHGMIEIDSTHKLMRK
jgi:hypothetical protein